jgi:hypothetical protein
MSTHFAIAWLARFAAGLAVGLTLGPRPDALMLGAALMAVGTARSNDVHDLTLFAAPLYGRQLARALAVPPCIAAAAFPVGTLVAMLGRGEVLPPAALGAALLGAVVAALVGLSGAIRTTQWRWAYDALAVLAALLVALPVWLGLPHALGLSLCLALALGFFALRAFGETLARYDPID